jgi:glycosyltransferase involved in cell wall biosynthesis
MRALAKHHRLTLVSNTPLEHPELRIEGANYLVCEDSGKRVGWLRYMWCCYRVVRKQRPNCVVLLHSRVAPVALGTGGVPTVLYWNEHPTHFIGAPDGSAPLKRLVRAGLRWLVFEGARRADLVMPIGEAHAADLVGHGCDPKRIRLIYMGVDPSFAGVALGRNVPDGEAPVELVYIGTVSKARGRDVMLEALALANRGARIARLTIVGADAEQQRHCQAYAGELGIGADVTIRGRIPGHAIPGVLAEADAGICLWEDRPWWRYNPPTKLFEYLVAGLPVLASNIGTHTRYVTHGHNGLIFEYDSASLAGAMADLWRRRGELPEFKRRAFNSGETYVWDKIEPAFIEAIDGMA